MTDKLKRSQKQAYEKQIKYLQALADRQSSEIKKLQDDLLWKNLLADCVLDTQERAEKAEAERDAAIIDLKLFAGCVACRHYCNHRRDHQESLLLTCCDCEKSKIASVGVAASDEATGNGAAYRSQRKERRHEKTYNGYPERQF